MYGVYVKNFDSKELFNINLNEVWRYAGYKGVPNKEEKLTSILNEVISDALEDISYRVCYIKNELNWDNEEPILPLSEKSKGLNKCLKGSSEFVMFAATVGIGFDRKIAKYQHISPVKALLFQALGAERIEALCDTFCKCIADEVKCQGLEVTPRFSAGYGDLPLKVQKDFFDILDCNRKIGLTLNNSLLMSPSKSVTAIFGIRKSNKTEDKKENKCKSCGNIECEYRRV